MQDLVKCTTLQGDSYLRIMVNNRLYKTEKLCSRTAINEIFAGGSSSIAYPLRIVYRITDAQQGGIKFLITIPKKKIRTAVNRVLLRRRTREAFRLNKNRVLPQITEQGKLIEVAFIYLSNDIADFDTINAKMAILLSRLEKIVIESTTEKALLIDDTQAAT